VSVGALAPSESLESAIGAALGDDVPGPGASAWMASFDVARGSRSTFPGESSTDDVPPNAPVVGQSTPMSVLSTPATALSILAMAANSHRDGRRGLAHERHGRAAQRRGAGDGGRRSDDGDRRWSDGRRRRGHGGRGWRRRRPSLGMMAAVAGLLVAVGGTDGSRGPGDGGRGLGDGGRGRGHGRRGWDHGREHGAVGGRRNGGSRLPSPRVNARKRRGIEKSEGACTFLATFLAIDPMGPMRGKNAPREGRGDEKVKCGRSTRRMSISRNVSFE
jgi:hypothetical protein